MNLLRSLIGSCIIILGIIACGDDTIDPVFTGTLTGQVVERGTNTPIENAKVGTNPAVTTVFSDANGMFTLEGVPEGDYSVQAENVGYLLRFQSVSVVRDQTSQVILDMELDDANNRAPIPVTLISPDTGSINVPLTFTFKWNTAVDLDSDPLTYKFVYGKEGAAVFDTVKNLADTTHLVNDLVFGQKYFWQVLTSDGVNADVASELRAFNTLPIPFNRLFYTKKEGANFVIYSSDEEGTDNITIKLTEPTESSWRPRKNPATNELAFLKNVGSETHIFTMKTDGTNQQQITTIPLAGFRNEELDFSWSANGDRILYPHFNKLYLINKDGSGLLQIYTTTNGKFISECDWASDESFIALKTNTNDGYNAEIYTIDMAGVPIDTILIDSLGAAGGLNITVDRQDVIYTYDLSHFQNASYRQLNTHIFKYNLASEVRTDLSINKPAGFLDLDPRLSPNEAEIIFQEVSNAVNSVPSVYRMGLNGENRTLVETDALMPDWE